MIVDASFALISNVAQYIFYDIVSVEYRRFNYRPYGGLFGAWPGELLGLCVFFYACAWICVWIFMHVLILVNRFADAYSKSKLAGRALVAQVSTN